MRLKSFGRGRVGEFRGCSSANNLKIQHITSRVGEESTAGPSVLIKTRTSPCRRFHGELLQDTAMSRRHGNVQTVIAPEKK